MSKGFTIIELIITIFILSVAVVGIYGAFSMMVVLTSNASDRLTAAYLVQEGMEIMRNVRDANWINSSENPETTWVEGFEECESETGGCEADYKTMGTVSSPLLPYGTSGDYLYLDADGFYSYDTSDHKTKFKRKILVSFLKDYVAKITVTVYWDEKPNILNPLGTPGSITAEEFFYNWYNYNG